MNYQQLETPALGKVELQFASSPDLANSKTSTLSAWSVATMLMNQREVVKFF